jgi:hypothetical protein
MEKIMKNRSPIMVFVFSLITVGIYYLVWLVKTKNEMNRLGEKIPTAWLWLVPIIGGIWWYWSYSKGVEHVTKSKMQGIVAFLLLFLISYIGAVIIQDAFNTVTDGSTGGVSPDVSLPTPAAGPAAFPPNPQTPTSIAPTPATPDNGQSQPQLPSDQQPGPTAPPQNPPLVSG